MEIRVGQLRRWIRPDHPDDKGKVFMILGEKTEWDSSVSVPPRWRCGWDFIMDGQAEWHYDDVLGRDSEVISEVG